MSVRIQTEEMSLAGEHLVVFLDSLVESQDLGRNVLVAQEFKPARPWPRIRLKDKD